MQLDPYGVDPEQLTPTQIKDMRARARAIMGEDRVKVDRKAEREGLAIQQMNLYNRQFHWWYIPDSEIASEYIE